MKKFKESSLFKKIEESLNETVTDLKNLFVSVDKMVNETVDVVGEHVDKVIGIASDEIQRASKETTDGFINAQSKITNTFKKLDVREEKKVGNDIIEKK